MITTLLFVPSDKAGCGWYRMYQPAQRIGDDPTANVIIHYDPTTADVDKADIVIIQRHRTQRTTQGTVDINKALVEHAKAKHKTVIFEADDYDAALPKHHGLYHQYKMDKTVEKIDWMLNNADAVTTTTEYLATKLAQRTVKPIYPIPNCYDPRHPMWNYPKTHSPHIRIGWAGGSSHQRDLNLLRGVFEIVTAKHKNTRFILCGFDTIGTYAFYDDKGKRQERPTEDHETIWRQMAKAYFGDIPPHQARTMKTLPIENYAFHFSQFDIGLIPLEDNEFNRCKSPLKLIEYGAYGVPVIVSQTEPYKDVAPNNLGITLPPTAKASEWAQAINLLIESPIDRDIYGTRLNRWIQKNFNATSDAKHRLNLYRQIRDEQ